MTGFFLLCPLPPEAAAAKAGLVLHERSALRANGPSATDSPQGSVRIVGMGPERARRACSRLESILPDGVPVVVLGVGGALVGGAEPGDLVVAEAVGLAEVRSGGRELEVTEPFRSLDASSEAFSASLACALHQQFASTRRATVLSTTRAVRGAERARLAESGAVICDTETAWLTALAERRPFAVVRSVVDAPGRELVSLRTVTGGIRALKRVSDAARIIAGVLDAENPPSRQPMSPTRTRT